jgi:2-methylcitrate dehydratase PrpD
MNTIATATPPATPHAAPAPLLATLAAFGHGLRLDAVPADARRQAKLCLLDTLGCMLAGADTEEGARFLRAEREAIGAPAVAATALPAAALGRVLGYWGDLFELNDLIGGHASIGNVATALAVARAQRSDGAALLRALIAGLEITSRVSEAHTRDKKPYPECGIVSVSVQSAIGASAVAASLCRLEGPAYADTLAIAGTIASWGPAEVIFGDGGTIKPILFGACPADSAVRAVGYARQGLGGPPRLLESRIGLFATVARRFDEALLRDDTRWHLLAPQRKLHACCGFTHSTIDVIGRLRARGIDLAAARRIELGVPAYIIPAISKPRAPTTPNEARFHIEYCAALAALGADVILPAHSTGFAAHMADPALPALMAKMAVQPIELPPGTGGHLYNHCRVRVELADGTAVEEAETAPRGSHARPLSEAELFDKFTRLAGPRLAADRVAACIDRCMAIEREADLGWLQAIVDEALGWRG